VGISLLNLVPCSSLQTKPCDVSVIIAHRGPEIGLWLTIESCIMDLEPSGLSYEFRICANDVERLTEDMKRIKHWTEKTEHVGEFLQVAQPMAPPSARQIVTENANGKYLFFFDNHCMPTRGYFKRGVESLQREGVKYLHSATRFFQGEGLNLDYKLSLKRDFWTLEPYRDTPNGTVDPYRVACSGHGGFAVRKETWQKIGGYFQGYIGYGGEETGTDLKVWRMGEEVWLDPQFIHLHWSGERVYSRHFNDDYYRNMLMCANIVGGDKWMHTVFNSMTHCTRFVKKGEPVTPLYDLLVQAEEMSTPYAKWVNLHSVMTLDEVLEHFKKIGVRY
jgi:hypothetical protein